MAHFDILTLIMAGGKGERLSLLTQNRAKPAVRFGAQYRIIDFTLSNCVNSNLRNIFVLTQYKSLSLERHIKEGWSFFDRRMNEYIDVIPPQQRIGTDWYRGTADAIYQNFYSIDQLRPRDLLILSGDHIYKMDYRQMIQAHQSTGADVTIATFPVHASEASLFGILVTDNEQRVTGFQEKPQSGPATIKDRPRECLANMGVYIFRTETLRRWLEDDTRNPGSAHDFGRDILPAMVESGERVMAYRFVDVNAKDEPYWRDVGEIEAYYAANMDLVQVEPIFNLYDPTWPIYTYNPQAPAPKFVFAQEYPGGRCGRALDSIVANGCIISGGLVQRSLLSQMVRINSFVHVKQSLLFDQVEVGRNCSIRRAIVDTRAKIPEGTEIGYDYEADKARFSVTPIENDQWLTIVMREAAAKL
ncbi:MAG: glucose-1-phosphate adenylyltransferase [Planctomycetota bacterium]|nr:MAG: glucose-1-phosphate adenylyltransferase [Planctomycetota bacterium]